MPRNKTAHQPALGEGFAFSMVRVGKQMIRVGQRAGRADLPPLLLFNGVGGNAELLEPFVMALRDHPVLTFDIPGVGYSPLPALPYRLSDLARLAKRLLDELGYSQCDVLGVSWGGTLAQQFTRSYPQYCRRLILAATTPGVLMVPGAPSVLLKMASPRRYFDAAYARRIVGDIYGGVFRREPERAREHFRHVRWQSKKGYYLQLLALTGWSSLPWLHRIRQPALVMVGADDPITPAVNGCLMQALLPNAELWRSDCGHLFLITEAEKSAAAVQRFLQ